MLFSIPEKGAIKRTALPGQAPGFKCKKLTARMIAFCISKITAPLFSVFSLLVAHCGKNALPS